MLMECAEPRYVIDTASPQTIAQIDHAVEAKIPIEIKVSIVVARCRAFISAAR